MKDYSLADLEVFRAVVESGSFSRAAERLGSSTASVSRRVSSLEAALAVRLLNRTTRRLNLTDAGRQFLTDIDGVLGALDEAEERAKAGRASVSGRLRVAAPMSFAVQRIAPLVADFLAQYPDVEIDLSLDDRFVDLHAQGADLAVRIGELEDSTLVATPICAIEVCFCASPAYLEKHGTPATREELVGHRCLQYTLVSRVAAWGLPPHQAAQIKGGLSANNGEVLCRAAIDGLGIVHLPKFIIADALERGELVTILETESAETLAANAVRLDRRYTPQRVSVFIDFLRERLSGSC